MQKRRAQGHFFNCDSKVTTGYKCRGSQLLLLEGSVCNEGDADEEAEETTTNLQLDPEISLHALIGWSIAKVRHYKVIVLIDNNSTHNFISEKVANLLHLPVQLFPQNNLRYKRLMEIHYGEKEDLRMCMSSFRVFPFPLPFIL